MFSLMCGTSGDNGQFVNFTRCGVAFTDERGAAGSRTSSYSFKEKIKSLFFLISVKVNNYTKLKKDLSHIFFVLRLPLHFWHLTITLPFDLNSFGVRI